jgi:hypothetical protein
MPILPVRAIILYKLAVRIAMLSNNYPKSLAIQVFKSVLKSLHSAKAQMGATLTDGIQEKTLLKKE